MPNSNVLHCGTEGIVEQPQFSNYLPTMSVGTATARHALRKCSRAAHFEQLE